MHSLRRDRLSHLKHSFVAPLPMSRSLSHNLSSSLFCPPCCVRSVLPSLTKALGFSASNNRCFHINLCPRLLYWLFIISSVTGRKCHNQILWHGTHSPQNTQSPLQHRNIRGFGMKRIGRFKEGCHMDKGCLCRGSIAVLSRNT